MRVSSPLNGLTHPHRHTNMLNARTLGRSLPHRKRKTQTQTHFAPGSTSKSRAWGRANPRPFACRRMAWATGCSDPCSTAAARVSRASLGEEGRRRVSVSLWVLEGSWKGTSSVTTALPGGALRGRDVGYRIKRTDHRGSNKQECTHLNLPVVSVPLLSKTTAVPLSHPHIPRMKHMHTFTAYMYPPVVSVPVLSRTTAVTLWAAWNASPPLIRMPKRAPTPVPTITAGIGVCGGGGGHRVD